MPRNGFSVRREINEVLEESGFIHIGGEKAGELTKSQYKELAKANGARNSHEIASQTPITSSSTLNRYREVYCDYARFGRAHGYGHNIKQYPPQVATEYLSDKINQGASWEDVKTECSAINKLDDILNACDGGSRDWSKEVAEMRDAARECCDKEKGKSPRAFQNPQAVIDNIASPEAKLVAEIQLTYGLRVHDASTIRLNNDNSLFIVSKNGYRVPHFEISPQIASQLRDLAAGRAVFTVMPYTSYLRELKAACSAAGEHYTGSHAFRHNFARDVYAEELSKGKSPTAAKAVVSEKLFHHRLEIVERYLR